MVADVKGGVRKGSEREKALDFRGADLGSFRGWGAQLQHDRGSKVKV